MKSGPVVRGGGRGGGSVQGYVVVVMCRDDRGSLAERCELMLQY